MKLTRYIALDAATSRPLDALTFPTLDDLEDYYAGRRPNIVPWRLDVDAPRAPFKVATLDADGILVITLAAPLDPAVLDHLTLTLKRTVGDRYLILDGDGAPIVAAEQARIAQDARERLPWDHYAPELRTRLKGLVARFPRWTVADCAVALAELIDEHGDAAVAERRRNR